MLDTLRPLESPYAIQNIRGLGLLVAFDLVRGDGKQLVDHCLRDGLIINSPKQRTVRLIPPLIVENSHIDRLKLVLARHLLKNT